MSTPAPNTPSTQSPSQATQLAPNYYVHTFPNGLRMVGQRMPSLASVTFGIQLAAGLRDEPADKGGLTNLLSDMLFQGTTHRTVRQLTDDFEAIGARRGAETGNESSRYSAQVVGTRFERALELMSDVVLNPTFPETEFEQMRAVQLQEIRRRDDEPMRRIFDLVRERFYIGTSLGRRSTRHEGERRGAAPGGSARLLAVALSCGRLAGRHRRQLRLAASRRAVSRSIWAAGAARRRPRCRRRRTRRPG